MKENFEEKFQRALRDAGGQRPSVLLHSCCGPCSSSVLERLAEPFAVTLLWYNPNLYPEAEFDRRLAAQKRLLEAAGLTEKVALRVLPWGSEAYYARVRGLEAEPEHGARCAVCIRLRLEETARLAAREGFDYFCTTLTLSRHKNAALINSLGEELGRRYGVAWLPSDFKKKGGELRSAQLCRQYGIYRQDYCGCEFSLHTKEKQERDLL